MATTLTSQSADPTPTRTPVLNRPVVGGPSALLRLEALALLVASIVAYRALGGGWSLFAALLLLPDLAMLGYLAGPRIGAAAYNAAHALLAPAALVAISTGLNGWSQPAPLLVLVALVWTAHIGMDRALGYGLKYASGFGDTHLGRVGRATGRDSFP